MQSYCKGQYGLLIKLLFILVFFGIEAVVLSDAEEAAEINLGSWPGSTSRPFAARVGGRLVLGPLGDKRRNPSRVLLRLSGAEETVSRM